MSYTWSHNWTPPKATPLRHTHTHTHICIHTTLSRPQWWFNLAAVARHEMGLNALNLNILSFWSAFWVVICSFWLIGLRLSPLPSHIQLLCVCLSMCRLVKLISLCCTFPLRHVLDKTSPASSARLHLLPEVDGWCGHCVCCMWNCRQLVRVAEVDGVQGYAVSMYSLSQFKLFAAVQFLMHF